MSNPPVIPNLPPAPTRSDAPADFSTKADTFVAALPPMVTKENELAAWQNALAVEMAGSATAAAGSATAAADSATSAGSSKSAAETAAQTAQIAAAASGASAGIGQLGNPGDSLQVNAARTGLVFGPSDGKVGDVLISARNPGPLFVPANGAIRAQSALPSLLGVLGLLRGQVGQQYATVSAGAAGAPVDVASAANPNGGAPLVMQITGNRAVNFSSDGGATWEPRINLPGTVVLVSSISYDGFNKLWLVAYSSPGGNQIAYTEDNAATFWKLTPAGAVLPSAGVSKIVADANGVWIATDQASSANIYRSIDKGTTWAAIATGASAIHTSISTDNKGVWCVTAGSTVRRSIDGGLTWTVQFTASSTINAISNDRNGVWLISGLTSNSNTYKSVDNGLTWTLLATPVTSTVTDIAYSQGFFFLVRSVSPQLIMISSAADATVYTLPSTAVLASLSKVTARGGYVVSVNTANSNILRSTPSYSYDSATQFSIPNIPTADGVRAWIRAGNKIVSSGRVFSFGATLDINPVEIATDGKGVVICVSATGAIRRSKDFGTTWSPVTSPVADNLTTIVTNLNGLWLIGSATGSLLRSTDNGATFTLVVNHGLSGNISQLVIGLNDVVVGCISSAAVPRRSTDGGLTWVNLSGVASAATVICTDRIGNWVLAQDSNTRRSNNNAVSFFTAVVTDLTLPPSDIKMNRDGFVYLCANSSLACRSSDYGQTWSSFSIIIGSQSPKFKVGEGQIVTIYSTARNFFRCSLNKGTTWLAPSPSFTPYCIAGGVDSPFIAISTSGSVVRTANLDTPI